MLVVAHVWSKSILSMFVHLPQWTGESPCVEVSFLIGTKLFCENNNFCSSLQCRSRGSESGTRQKKTSKEQRGSHKVCTHLIHHTLSATIVHIDHVYAFLCISDEHSMLRQNSKTQSAEAIMDKYIRYMEKRSTHSDGAGSGNYIGQGLPNSNIHALYTNAHKGTHSLSSVLRSK